MTGNLPALCVELKLRHENGVVLVCSRDLAEMFGKQHQHVLRDIDNMLKSLAVQNWTVWVREVSEFDKGANRVVRSFDLTRRLYHACLWLALRPKTGCVMLATSRASGVSRLPSQSTQRPTGQRLSACQR
jgi:hypothetical protein